MYVYGRQHKVIIMRLADRGKVHTGPENIIFEMEGGMARQLDKQLYDV